MPALSQSGMSPRSFKTVPTLIIQATTPTTIPAIDSPSVRVFVLLIKPNTEKAILTGRSKKAYVNIPIIARTNPMIMYASVMENGCCCFDATVG